MKPLFVSIIVPTYNDWDRLAICLNALSAQTYPQTDFEIIIANNNPADARPLNFLLPLNAKLITVAKPGSYAARNAALKMAKGRIIGFTDSDCIPQKDWITNAVTYLAKHPACSRIAGHISIVPQGAKPTLADLYNQVFEFPQPSYARFSGTGVTANLFAYKHVFDAVGPFNENLLSLGDLEWGKGAHKAGFAIHYVRGVEVQHPARTLAELKKKVKRVGGGQATMRRGTLVQNLLHYVSDNRPRVYIIRHIYRYGKDLSLVDKIKVLFLRHYLLNLRAAEKLRVQQGKQPQRA